MKDWEKCVADKTVLIRKHYTKGREGHSIRKIVLHHNAGNLTVEGCYKVWQTRQASAHYQVQSDGVIGQLVNDHDTAWHAGNWGVNLESIGIEHADESNTPWRISEKCLDNGAHLLAALCKLYKLGRPQWRVNVFPHSDFRATSCPCSLRESQNSEYMQRAQKYYDAMTSNKPPVTSTQPTTPTPPLVSPTIRANGVSSITLHIPWGENSGQCCQLARTGNTVTVNGSGWIKSGGGSWVKAWEHIPDGYKPISVSTISLSGNGNGSLMVKPDGTIYWDGEGKTCYTHITGTWVTVDKQPK